MIVAPTKLIKLHQNLLKANQGINPGAVFEPQSEQTAIAVTQEVSQHR